MTSLPAIIKKAAVAAFHDNTLLSQMTPEEREQAAEYHKEVAAVTRGTMPNLAMLYHLERAKFLRGEVVRIADTAPRFAEEIGYQRK
jgi:hypothetical protein